MCLRISDLCIVRAMDGPQLLQALMDSANPRWNSNSLAVRLGNKSLQPQIYRFLKGELIEPRRETFRPIATFFAVPLDAFYEPDLAERVALERRLIVGGAPLAVSSPTMPQTPKSVRGMLEQLTAIAKPQRPALRKSLATMLVELVENPDDPGLLEQTITDIERIFGVPLSGEIRGKRPKSGQEAA